MIRTSVRRCVGAIVAPVLVVSATTALAVPAQASTLQPPAPPAASAAVSWLATQLTNGVVHNDAWGSDDYGLTADIALSMDQVGSEPGIVRQLRQAMAEHVDSYTTGADFGAPDDVYSGAVAKSLVLAQVSGADPRAYGGFDLVSVAEGTVIDSGPSAGRLADASEFGDYANTIGQALAARGLSNAASPKAPAVTDFLLQQQCDAGYFRVFFASDKAAPQQGCVDGDAQSPADTDATAMALIHLDAIRTPSPVVRSAIAKGAKWLAQTQKVDGSFGGGASTPDANANSTGLAASALGSFGACTAAGRAAEWVSALQLSSSSGAGLGSDEGAIAYDRAALQQAVSSRGIGGARDQWRRTTAQAVGGLTHRLGATGGVAFTAPSTGGPGEKVVIVASGLVPGDRFCLTGPGVEGERQLVVASDGELRAPIALQGTVGRARYALQGRDGAVTVDVEVRNGAPLSSVAGVSMTAPTGPQRARSTVRLAITGAKGGSRFVLAGRGLAPVEVVAGSDGALDRMVRLPRATQRVTYTLTGRDGEVTASVRVLGRAKLRVKAPRSAARGDKVRVVVTRLAPRERVILRLAGRKVAAGKANKAGRLVKRIKVSAPQGRRKLVAVGQFANRKGRTTVRVR